MTQVAGVGSVPLARRAGGPDLARGLALLGIALANTIGWLHGSPWTVLLKQLDATVADRIVDALIGLTADNRGFPLFAMLFGYGIGIILRRSREAGERSGHVVLRMLRRHVALLVIGLAHAILLFSGDILIAYAMVGMLCVLLATRHRAVLPLAALLALPALGVWGWVDGTIGLFGSDGYPSAAAPDYLTSLRLRTDEAGAEVATSLVSDIGLLTPMAIGAIAARLRLFEEVAANRDVLVPIARWGLGLGLLGAVPLVTVLVLDPAHQHLDSEIVLGSLGVLHQYTGLLGALGLAAAAALVSDRVRRSSGADGADPSGHLVRDAGPVSARPVRVARPVSDRLVQGIEALGAVSLSAYVGQSLVFLALFPPYTLDLGARLGTAGAAAIVMAVWLAMIPGAVALKRRGRRGPLEVVLRRLAGSASPRVVPDRSSHPSPTGGRS
ncbi:MULTISPECIES: DUF418 domain-containing protein [unclassified Brachybacterium]|uniref:DUF418 domain-containing protein n=1 Tax=unclassified Brachybacterium TaxID=2623841 RepID=UPI0040336E9C